jgi:hypothetical protein
MILDAIKCVNCQKLVETPVILPCTHSICEKHSNIKPNDNNDDEDENLKNQTIFCNACGVEHSIPLKGFTHNAALAQIVNARIDKIDLGEEHTSAKRMCEKLDDLITKCQQIVRDPTNFTYEAIYFLKNEALIKGETMKLLLTTTRSIADVDAKIDRIMVLLDEFKEECKKSVHTRAFEVMWEDFGAEVEKARGDLGKWMAILNTVKLDSVREWTRIQRESKKMVGVLEYRFGVFKYKLLLEKRFAQIRGQVELEFGKVELDSAFELE